MTDCLVPNCKSRTQSKLIEQFKEETYLGKPISFFKFPSCPKMQNIWRNNLFDKQATNIQRSQESKICEKHFAPTDFIKYNYNDAILKKIVVPNLSIKPIDWIRSAKSRLDGIDRDVEDIDIDWLPISGSINIDCNIKCRFCLKTKKETILNCWRDISTPKFKEMYLQITGFEAHISDKLPQFCCILCYDRISEAADTMSHFQKCHLKLENVLHEIHKNPIDSLQANENYVNDVIPTEFLDLSSDNNNETIKDENTDNESVDPGKINQVVDGESILKKEKPIKKCQRICRFCAEEFDSRSTYMRHMKEKHEEHFLKNDTVFRCDYCGLKYPSELKFNDHIENHHVGQPIGSLECKRCPGHHYANKRSYGRHIYYKHSSLRDEAIVSLARPAVSIECPICKKVSKSHSLLNQHIYLVHKPKTCRCEICGKMFINQYKRKDHQKIHTGERSLICEICGMNFLTKFTLANHQKRVHDEVDRRRRTSSALASLPCTICDKKYVKLKNIKRHMEQVHTEISKQEWQLLLNRSCVRCNSIFDNEEYLKDHQKNTCNGIVQ